MTNTQLVRVHNLSVSLDGFATGDGRTADEPFGHASLRLHQWFFDTAMGRAQFGEPGGTTGLDNAIAEMHDHDIGAEIMGRGKFGWQTGPWADESWRGWWGETPPFHTPVFVLTHHLRPSLEMDGGTTFHFRDAAPADVVEEAKKAAGGRDVRLGGGPSVVRDFLVADLVDHMHVVVVPILLGRGVRLWDGLEGLDQRFDIETVASPSGVQHVTFTKKAS
ncbi:dihydrofolate reductase family protein [Labedaea rhizosphaerae]|uniref:Dihydrofolate reductase n=1 Tax=Labedaea rhizosphaerae TaxID=598644 RepID=A0A4R6SBW5_LABRH|nr:dihydrofolate reductase family protein [Labedaea rhizosphaerae]TDP96516.1 dihydrofolate reductase [Labedaea rhizosphaerae]